jgi:hypothetical protein
MAAASGATLAPFPGSQRWARIASPTRRAQRLSFKSMPNPEEPNPEQPIIIKMYANRRLYNTGACTYVAVDDLAGMVRRGKDFAVYDAGSGEDITRSLLMLISPTTTEH